MQKKNGTTPHRPSIYALDPWTPGKPNDQRRYQLLSPEEQMRLATIASIMRFRKGELIYRQGDEVKAVFNIVTGVVKACQGVGPTDEHIAAFLYPQDLFGLSEEGRYVCSVRAVTSVTVYALPISALRRHLSSDAQLDYNVVVKLCHELREAQRHALLLAQRHALTRIAMFLQLQEQHQSILDEASDEIYLPMTRSDIADFIGISLPAVSRAFRELTTRHVVKFVDRQHLLIADRPAFDALTRNLPSRGQLAANEA
ncbi:MAG TPA: Crp/Fnr family transcriptional regulator [Terriglobales bacterium]|nr:Crp/Fnr family transcriptional regulator [Terriglobales bacterium]